MPMMWNGNVASGVFVSKMNRIDMTKTANHLGLLLERWCHKVEWDPIDQLLVLHGRTLCRNLIAHDKKRALGEAWCCMIRNTELMKEKRLMLSMSIPILFTRLLFCAASDQVADYLKGKSITIVLTWKLRMTQEQTLKIVDIDRSSFLKDDAYMEEWRDVYQHNFVTEAVQMANDVSSKSNQDGCVQGVARRGDYFHTALKSDENAPTSDMHDSLHYAGDIVTNNIHVGEIECSSTSKGAFRTAMKTSIREAMRMANLMSTMTNGGMRKPYASVHSIFREREKGA